MEPIKNLDPELKEAVRSTAPGTALRYAIDMMLSAGLGALICIGDVENVLHYGEDGFPLDISFTANRLFELSKMDGAIVIDEGLTRILRANCHLNPDPGLPTRETGMRHRAAARMSQVTEAMIIAVSERRSVATLFVNGRSYVLRRPSDVMTSVSQLLVTLQSTRSEIDQALSRLTSLELEDSVTFADVMRALQLYEVLMSASDELEGYVLELGSEGRTVGMRCDEIMGDADASYTMLIRDYAQDSSAENAEAVRQILHETAASVLRLPARVSEIMGLGSLRLDSEMTPLGLRTLSKTSLVRAAEADKIVDEYGSLPELVGDLGDNPTRLDEIGVHNPSVLADRLSRMKGRGSA